MLVGSIQYIHTYTASNLLYWTLYESLFTLYESLFEIQNRILCIVTFPYYDGCTFTLDPPSLEHMRVQPWIFPFERKYYTDPIKYKPCNFNWNNVLSKTPQYIITVQSGNKFISY